MNIVLISIVYLYYSTREDELVCDYFYIAHHYWAGTSIQMVHKGQEGDNIRVGCE